MINRNKKITNKDKTPTKENTDNNPPMNLIVTILTQMKKQTNIGKHTKDNNIDNIKIKTKTHTKTLLKDKIEKTVTNNNILWTINHPKIMSKTIQTSRIQPTKNHKIQIQQMTTQRKAPQIEKKTTNKNINTKTLCCINITK